MVPISKSIYIHTSSEYCQLFLNESPAKFIIRWQKAFSGIVQNPLCQSFRPVFVQGVQFCPKISYSCNFVAQESPSAGMGPVEGLRRNREGVGCLPGRSGFCRALLGRVDKDGQHGHGKEDAYGVRHSGIVNGGTLSGLTVQQAAQALRCQHEVGAGHGAHEGSGNSGDPEVLLFFKVAAPFLFCAFLHTKTAGTTHRSGCGVKFLCRSRRFLRSWFLPVLNRSAPYFTVRAA